MRLRVWPLLLCLCACERVLDIDEATIDPALDDSQDGCSKYCDLVMENCQAEDAVYSSHDACMSLCANMPAGDRGATAGNSVQCRLRAAELAPAEPSFYCPGAGPGGNGVCGENCESFCQMIGLVCSGDNAGYADEDACLSDCVALPDLGTFSLAPAPRGAMIQCRLYHLTNATIEPDRHCAHALGGSPCK